MPRDESEGGEPGQRRHFTSVKKAAHESSFGLGGNSMSPRQALHGRKGARRVQAKSGFSCHLASPPFPAQNQRLQKPKRKWGGLIVIHPHHHCNRVGPGKGEVLTLKVVQSFDYYRSFRGNFLHYYMKMARNS